MVADRIATEVQGIVACANDRGVKLAGESEWRNVSKFSTGIVIPSAGAHVVLGLDRAGYVREISTAEPEKGERNPTPASATCTVAASKDVMIARMNSLGHALNLLQCGGNTPTLSDLVETAEFLAAWITR